MDIPGPEPRFNVPAASGKALDRARHIWSMAAWNSGRIRR